MAVSSRESGMSDFIEVYPDVLPPEFCDVLIQAYEGSQQKKNSVIPGGVAGESPLSEICLNTNPCETEVNQLINYLVPYLCRYLSRYYQVLLAGTSLTIAHPVTKEPVRLSPDNFAEMGLPHVDMIMRRMFRLGPMVLQKSKAEAGITTCFHSESCPQQSGDENLHRLLNIAVFLGDVEDGGEIEFCEYPRNIAPKRGSLVVFPSYFTHAHRQRKPLSDDKYQINSWLMFNRTAKLYKGQ